jgi:ankyrin repeat protein
MLPLLEDSRSGVVIDGSHLLAAIFLFLDPKDLMNILLLNKSFKSFFNAHLKDQAYWEAETKRHFPHTHPKPRPDLNWFDQFFILQNINWFETFFKLQKEHYRGLTSRQVDLFSAVKSGDLAQLKIMRPTLEELRFEELPFNDSRREAVCNHLASFGNQCMMDYVFHELVIPFYTRADGSLDKKKWHYGRTVLHFAAMFDQGSYIAENLESMVAETDHHLSNYDARSPLQLAAHHGNLEAMTALVVRGVNIDRKAGPTALSLAIASGNEATVEYLVHSNADINLAGNPRFLDQKPLHQAALFGNLAMFTLLLNLNADIHLGENNTPVIGPDNLLHCAAIGGNEHILSAVIQMRCFDINSRNRAHKTPLHQAAERGNFAAFKLLIESKADTSLVDEHGWNLLHFAVKGRCLDVVKWVIDTLGFDVNSTSNHGETALHAAALERDTRKDDAQEAEIIDYLFARGAVVDVADAHQPPFDEELPDGGNETPLHVAARYSNVLAVKKLLDRGAEVNAVTDGGYTPLHYAMNRFNHEVVDLLLKYGADVNAMTKDVEPDDDGEYDIDGMTTPLMRALMVRVPTSIIMKLLEYPHRLDLASSDGSQVLHCALFAEHSVIERLIALGADIHAVDKRDRTPVQCLIRHDRGNRHDNHIDTIHLLLRHAAKLYGGLPPEIEPLAPSESGLTLFSPPKRGLDDEGSVSKRFKP